MAYQHVPEDADALGYLPYDGQGRPIPRAEAERIKATAPAQADPEDLPYWDHRRSIK